MHVQREGAEAVGGRGGQFNKQPGADATPSGIFSDGHRELRKRHASIVEHERGLMEVQPSGTKGPLIVVASDQREIRQSGQRREDGRIVR